MRRSRWLCLTFALLCSLGCGGTPPPFATTPAKPKAAVARVTTKHCREVVWQFDIPRCLEEVSPSVRARMVEGRILTYRDGRVVKIASVNGEGFPVEEHGNATEEFIYTGERLTGVRLYDRFGKLRRKDVISADRKRKTNLDPWGRPFRDGEVSSIERDFDARGYILRLRCFDAENQPSQNDSGIHELRWERDRDGQIIGETGFDEQGQPATYFEGYHRLEREVDARGNVLAVRYFDLEGKPVVMRQGIHESRQAYDQYGNLVRVEWFGVGGVPVRHVMGNHAYDVTRDAEGHALEYLYVDIGGAPVMTSLGYAGMQVSYNDHGLPKERRMFDTDRRPIIGADGFARSVHEYDRRDREIETRYFGTDDEPLFVFGAHASLRYSYNARDQITAKSYFGLDGELTKGGNWAVWKAAYDEFDQMTEQGWFYADGRASETRGYSRQKVVFDARGKVTDRVFTDAKGAPVEVLYFAEVVVRFAGAPGASQHITRSALEARKRIEEARDRIRGGLPFRAAVLMYSDDAVGRWRSFKGIAGYYTPKTVRPGIGMALAKLEVDQVSDVIEETWGYLLVQRLAVE